MARKVLLFVFAAVAGLCAQAQSAKFSGKLPASVGDTYKLINPAAAKQKLLSPRGSECFFKELSELPPNSILNVTNAHLEMDHVIGDYLIEFLVGGKGEPVSVYCTINLSPALKSEEDTRRFLIEEFNDASKSVIEEAFTN